MDLMEFLSLEAGSKNGASKSLTYYQIKDELTLALIHSLDGVKIYYITRSIEKKPLDIIIKGKFQVYISRFFGILLISIEDSHRSLWIPKMPKVRVWDQKGRIKNEFEPKAYIKTEDDLIKLAIIAPHEKQVGFVVVQVQREAERIVFEEITNSNWAEGRSITVVGPWTSLNSIACFWDYIISASIYDSRYGKVGRWRSEQTALSLYNIAKLSEAYTKNKIYTVLKTEIAHCVLLSLDEKGRWKHGHWTDEMETHTRFQIDGIHLLVEHYKETGDKIFLEKALLAMNYLLSIADQLEDGGIWFLHDSLELTEEGMKKYISPVVKCRAFGKNLTNTLTLNTHISTLCALIRLCKETGDKELISYMERGLNGLRVVLEKQPASLIFKILYALVNLSFDTSKRGSLIRILRRLSRQLVIPRLSYIKRVFPRLVMPNGYIDRDLGLLNQTFYYHIVNLYDLLILYQLKPENWIFNTIRKGIDYCFRGNLISYLIATKNFLMPLYADVLLMYASLDVNFDKAKLVRGIFDLLDAGYSLTPGVYGFDNLIVPEEHQCPEVKALDPYILTLNVTPRFKNGPKELLLVNTTFFEKQIELQFEDRYLQMNPKIEVLTRIGETPVKFDQPIRISPREYLSLRINKA